MIRRNSPGGIALLIALALLLGACSDDDETALTLPAPQNVAASVEDFTATVTWDNAAGATSYNLYRAPTSAVDPAAATKFAAVTSPYTDTGLAPNTIYHYAATAVYPEGESGISASAEAKCPPPAPAITSAVPGDGQVTISWTDVQGADSYSLYWDTDPDVSAADAEIPVGSETTYLHTGLTNGTTCYYVVTAVSATTGESALSAEVGATPAVPVAGAPTNVTAVPTEEVPNSITITWDGAEGAVSYNIYWATDPGVDDTDNRIEGAVSPYDHTGLAGMTTYYYKVAGVDDGENVGPLSIEVFAKARGSPRPGADTGFGNNLSLPVVFAEGRGITGLEITGAWTPDNLALVDYGTGLRPLSTETPPSLPHYDPADEYLLNNVVYYQQGGASTWQAQWGNGAEDPQDAIVDWGDNLGGSATLTANQVIRVETVLFQDSTIGYADSLAGYTMKLLYGSETTEMQGTDTTTYLSNRRNVFSFCARLTIEKLDGDTVVFTAFDNTVYEAVSAEGQVQRYTAELNVGGSLVYGFNFAINRLTMPEGIPKTGTWRATFSLDPEGVCPVAPNVTLVKKADAAATLDPEGTATSIVFTVQ